MQEFLTKARKLRRLKQSGILNDFQYRQARLGNFVFCVENFAGKLSGEYFVRYFGK